MTLAYIARAHTTPPMLTFALGILVGLVPALVLYAILLDTRRLVRHLRARRERNRVTVTFLVHEWDKAQMLAPEVERILARQLLDQLIARKMARLLARTTRSGVTFTLTVDALPIRKNPIASIPAEPHTTQPLPEAGTERRIPTAHA